MVVQIKRKSLQCLSFALTVIAMGWLVLPAYADGGRAGEDTTVSTRPTPATPTVQPTRTPAPAPAPTPSRATSQTPTAPATATPQRARTTQTPQRQATRRTPRAIVETAPSGLPPQGETRFEPDELIVRFQLSSTNATRDRAIRGLGIQHLGVRTFAWANVTVHRYRLPADLSVREAITRLEASAAVVNAQPNYIYQSQQSDGASKLPQFGNSSVELAQAHLRTTGADIRIAVIDTAVDTTHAEFSNAKISSFDVSEGAGNVDAHGTSVAGILAANGKLTGVAPDAEIVSIAAFSTDASGQSFGNTWSIMNAFNIAQDQAVHVINMSFSGPSDPLLERAMQGASQANILAVAAAGNDGPEAATLYPAGYETVVSVTAIDNENAIYSKANSGAHIDFAAPGVDLLVLGNTSGFRTSSGTSMATAYISGIASLILSANPGMDAGRVKSLLETSAIDLGTPGKDNIYGYGLPSAAAAVNGLIN